MSHDMLTREIGASGIRASAVGLGTWAIGGWMWGGTDEAASIAAIQASIDDGITLIDTAPAYGMGRSEEIVGKAIAGRRDEVVLATKCGLVWHTDKGNHFFDQDGKPVHRYLGPESIAHELEQSLKRLGTDHIDLYITHWQDPTTPIAETMEALRDAEARRARSARSAPATCRADDLDGLCRGRAARCDPGSSTAWSSATSRRRCCRSAPSTASRSLSYSSLALGLLTGKIGPERDVRRRRPAQGQSALLARQPARRSRGFAARDRAGRRARTAPRRAQIVIAWTLQPAGHHLRALRRAQPGAGDGERRAPARIRLSTSRTRHDQRGSNAPSDGPRRLTAHIETDKRSPPSRRRTDKPCPNARRHARRADGAATALRRHRRRRRHQRHQRRSANWRCRACACCWSSATTSARAAARRPSRMIHGGLRYLENGEFDLVRGIAARARRAAAQRAAYGAAAADDGPDPVTSSPACSTARSASSACRSQPAEPRRAADQDRPDALRLDRRASRRAPAAAQLPRRARDAAALAGPVAAAALLGHLSRRLDQPSRAARHRADPRHRARWRRDASRSTTRELARRGRRRSSLVDGADRRARCRSTAERHRQRHRRLARRDRLRACRRTARRRSRSSPAPRARISSSIMPDAATRRSAAT